MFIVYQSGNQFGIPFSKHFLNIHNSFHSQYIDLYMYVNRQKRDLYVHLNQFESSKHSRRISSPLNESQGCT